MSERENWYGSDSDQINESIRRVVRLNGIKVNIGRMATGELFEVRVHTQSRVDADLAELSIIDDELRRRGIV